MPGIIGIIDPSKSERQLKDIIEHMTAVIRHDDRYKIDSFNFESSISAARVHLGIFNDYKQPVLKLPAASSGESSTVRNSV